MIYVLFTQPPARAAAKLLVPTPQGRRPQLYNTSQPSSLTLQMLQVLESESDDQFDSFARPLARTKAASDLLNVPARARPGTKMIFVPVGPRLDSDW